MNQLDALAALADPTRRRIVELLARRDQTAGQIVDEFDVTAPAISQHLKVLRDAGLVRVRAEGQFRIHSIDPAGFGAIDAWLARTRKQWERRLDALERALVAENKSIHKKNSP